MQLSKLLLVHLHFLQLQDFSLVYKVQVIQMPSLTLHLSLFLSGLLSFSLVCRSEKRLLPRGKKQQNKTTTNPTTL